VLLDAGDELGHRRLVGGEAPLREATAATGLQRGAHLGVVEASGPRPARSAIAAAAEEEAAASARRSAAFTAPAVGAAARAGVTPWAFRQATNFDWVADVDPPAAELAALPELAELDDVLELEPQATRTSAVTTTVPASIARRTVRK
jgi:hypothetical protein